MMQNKLMFGITGGSGAGKTTVSNIFRECGIYIIDADIVAREVQTPGAPCTLELAKEFGADILDENGQLMRRKLAGIVFSDEDRLAKLNEITHKYITARAFELARECGGNCGIDGAVLIESGIAEQCRYIVGVIADRDTRIRRIMRRDRISWEEARKRIDAQKPDSFYIANSDFVVRNDDAEDCLKWQIQKIIEDAGVREEGSRRSERR